MNDLHEILRPAWGAERWILEGWEKITAEEKLLITSRMDALFANGLPFELKHEKILYIYTFSLLAQLEVLAIQVPLKFADKLSSKQHQQAMRTQLLDEIFHGMVFTKILYMLCSPYAFPPDYNEKIEELCDFIRGEDCPKIAFMLLNLVAESWIEQLFDSLEQANIAPRVFATIIEDESRHVAEADLYHEIGLPTKQAALEKLAFLEEKLLSIFTQYNYVYSVSVLLGIEHTTLFIEKLHAKHASQLDKIHIKPGENWQYFLRLFTQALSKIDVCSEKITELEMTPLRKILLTQWNNPGDPTGVVEYNLDITQFNYFARTKATTFLTPLMLQTISATVKDTDILRHYMSHYKLYRSNNAYVGLVVLLPQCDDQLGTIVFEDCHTWSLMHLSERISTVRKMMVYCYQKRQMLEQEDPTITQSLDAAIYGYLNNTYKVGFPGTPFVSVSNIGNYGFTHAFSPLRTNEAVKFTLLAVDKRQVWNCETNQFEARDILPISISGDHRCLDANLPGPQYTATNFEKMLTQMHAHQQHSPEKPQLIEQDDLTAFIDHLIEKDKDIAYQVLLMLQTYWLDFCAFEDLFNRDLIKEALEHTNT